MIFKLIHLVPLFRFLVFRVIYFDVINRHYFIKVVGATNFNFTIWLKLEVLKRGCKHLYPFMHTIYTLEKERTIEGLTKQTNERTASEM